MIALWLLCLCLAQQSPGGTDWEQWRALVNGSMVATQTAVKQMSDEGRSALKDHETRMRELETWKVQYGDKTKETLDAVLAEIKAAKSDASKVETVKKVEEAPPTSVVGWGTSAGVLAMLALQALSWFKKNKILDEVENLTRPSTKTTTTVETPSAFGRQDDDEDKYYRFPKAPLKM